MIRASTWPAATANNVGTGREYPARLIYLLLLLGFSAGCRGTAPREETAARKEMAAVAQEITAPLPPLTTNSTLADSVRFAVRNHPGVWAAYADWRAAVENITVARSLPDPKLTFEFYAADALTSLMPGLSEEWPGPGKRAARAAEASAESRVKYWRFEAAALNTAFEVEETFYPLSYLDARLAVNRRNLDLLTRLESLARTQNTVGQATLQDVLRAQIEEEKLRKETASLVDSRGMLLARFKSALGLASGQPDPPVPPRPVFAELPQNDESLLRTALNQNAQLKELEAEVGVAEASIRVAAKERTPDFSTGLEVDAKAAPAVWNPQFSMTLPIWRDKLAAELASAQAGRQAAQARLSAAQIDLVASFAEQAWLIRDANRELDLLQLQLLPMASQALQLAQSAYQSGRTDFLNVIESERALLDFQLDEIAAESQRAVARARLVTLIAGQPPQRSPLPDAAGHAPTP